MNVAVTLNAALCILVEISDSLEVFAALIVRVMMNATFQKTAIFLLAAARTSNLIKTVIIVTT
jgi:hypothetical protein